MRRLSLLLFAAFFAAGCTPQPAEPAPSPAVPTPSSVNRLPVVWPVDGPLGESDNAAKVVRRLHAELEYLPVLKLDVTQTQATMTVLRPDESLSTMLWSNGRIEVATSDFEYLGQATFNPDDFPLANIGRMFDVADLRGLQGKLIYQVQEYRAGAVMQTVSSSPESSTIFFDNVGAAVPSITDAHAQDVVEGLRGVITEEPLISFGYSSVRGWWSQSLADNTVNMRTRTGGIPTLLSSRTATGNEVTFPSDQVNPMVIAQIFQAQRAAPDDECRLDVVLPTDQEQPVMVVQCGDAETSWTLAGESVTE